MPKKIISRTEKMENEQQPIIRKNQEILDRIIETIPITTGRLKRGFGSDYTVILYYRRWFFKYEICDVTFFWDGDMLCSSSEYSSVYVCKEFSLEQSIQKIREHILDIVFSKFDVDLTK